MNYPTINIKALNGLIEIVEQAAEDPKYLDPEVCPYDEKTITIIRKVMEIDCSDHRAEGGKPEKGKVGRPTKGPSIPMDEVEKEINEIRTELASLKIDGQAMETSDRIQVIKTRAALIEKVLSMKERVADIKRFQSFVQTVIGIMEEHLTPKERDAVIGELKKYVEI